ncbi:MAG: heme A synthase, partial [Gammaproteobacteria bacterium]|nr:heme A synthase [Gammaproteobacteria bacterium]
MHCYAKRTDTFDGRSGASEKSIAIWLLVCCVAVFAMIVLGGVTRLTGSGLSMVQWEPVMGTLPPLNQLQWENAFSLYQQFPEYKLKNSSMSLGEFKFIFWFEYAHRLLGRSIGVIFLLPFLLFLIQGKIARELAPKLVTMFILGGLQGLMGWYMVKSGLVDLPHVSQYRLTAHLALAIIIYAYMLWVALDLLYPKVDRIANRANSIPRHMSLAIAFIVFVTCLSGGFVAGTRAGYAFNTFPLMNGRIIPPGLFDLSPAWRNLFENIVTVQFDHRLLATLLFLVIPAFWWIARNAHREPGIRVGLNLLLAALALQITLGLSTLLMVVPVALAAAHQAG